jgi:hypothetical protein
MMLLERCHEVSYLTLRLCGQQVNVVQEELPLHRQGAGIHQSLAAPFTITFSNHCQLH